MLGGKQYNTNCLLRRDSVQLKSKRHKRQKCRSKYLQPLLANASWEQPRKQVAQDRRWAVGSLPCVTQTTLTGGSQDFVIGCLVLHKNIFTLSSVCITCRSDHLCREKKKVHKLSRKSTYISNNSKTRNSVIDFFPSFFFLQKTEHTSNLPSCTEGNTYC